MSSPIAFKKVVPTYIPALDDSADGPSQFGHMGQVVDDNFDLLNPWMQALALRIAAIETALAKEPTGWQKFTSGWVLNAGWALNGPGCYAYKLGNDPYLVLMHIQLLRTGATITASSDGRFNFVKLGTVPAALRPAGFAVAPFTTANSSGGIYCDNGGHLYIADMHSNAIGLPSGTGVLTADFVFQTGTK